MTNTPSRPVSIAVVGVGALGRHHARILSGLPEANLVAVADSHAKRGQAVAANSDCDWVADYTQLPDSIDAVVIAVPTQAHFPVASHFLNQHKSILVEKPLTSNVQEAEQLVDHAESANVLLQVGHVERFNPATTAAWSLCGSPRYIQAERCSPYSFRSTDIGVVHDVMIHDIDLILSLVSSPIKHVEAFGICLMGGHEDSVRARLHFENGCIADLTANRVNPTSKRSMQIWSGSGTTTIDFGDREVCHYRPSETLLYGTPPVERAAQPNADIEQLKSQVFGTFLEVEQPLIPQSDALTAELENFIHCIQTDSVPEVDGRQALAALRVADQILQSVESHQWDGHADGAVGPHVKTSTKRRMAG